MRPLLLALVLTVPAAAQTATPVPCDALAAFLDADLDGRLAFARDERNRTPTIATFSTDTLGLGPEAYLWVDYMESGELFAVALHVEQPAVPTTVEAWQPSALALADALGRAAATCVGSDGPAEAPTVWDEEGHESVDLLVAEGVRVRVDVERGDAGDLRLAPSLAVGVDY